MLEDVGSFGNSFFPLYENDFFKVLFKLLYALLCSIFIPSISNKKVYYHLVCPFRLSAVYLRENVPNHFSVFLMVLIGVCVDKKNRTIT